mgnify:CR=1 FL=1
MNEYFSKNKKLILFIVLQNIVLFSLLGAFFYFKYYEPLKNDSYLFPENTEESAQLEMLDIREFNEQYIDVDGYLRDKYGNRLVADPVFGIEVDVLAGMIRENKNLYIVDVREIEEYNAGHIEGAVHYRVMDIDEEGLKEKLDLSEEEYGDTLIVLVCHDGGRGFLKAKELNQENIKYLIAGIEATEENKTIALTGPVFADYEIFDKSYQTKFQMRASDAIKQILEDGAFVIDGRHITQYERKRVVDSLHLKIGHMTSEEYEAALEKVLVQKDKKIIITPDRYSELFYANLLILRLVRDYGFSEEQFGIVFNQFDKFEKDGRLEFENLLSRNE